MSPEDKPYHRILILLTSVLIITSVSVTGLGTELTSAAVATGEAPPVEAWNETYGGDQREDIWGMTATSDAGFMLVGISSSFGDSDGDLWAVKIDSTGIEEWNRTYGGTDAILASKTELGADVVESIDGGYAFAGWTTSFGAGESDGWLVKVNGTGHEEWNRTYGDAERDTFNAISRTSDGGYVLVGTRQRDLGFGNVDSDVWVVKVNATGHEEWTYTDPVDGTDLGRDIVETADGGFAVLADPGQVNDFLLIRLDSTGQELWTKRYGGNRAEDAKALALRNDGGFVLAGQTTSFGDTSGDAFLVSVNETGVPDWTAVLGGEASDMAWDVIPSADGGFVLGGRTSSFDAVGTDAWIAKVDANGAELWNATFGGSNTDNARRVVGTATGYALGGNTWSFSGSNHPDAWLVNLVPAADTPAAPEIVVSPSSVDFGNISIGSEAMRNLTIGNVGDAPLNVTDVGLIGDEAGAFTVISGGTPTVLAPGGTRNVTIAFSPASTGDRSATLRIESNDTDESTVDVPLTGTGVEESDDAQLIDPNVPIATGFFMPQVDGILYGYGGQFLPPDVVREWDDGANETITLQALGSNESIGSRLFTKQVRDRVFVGLAVDDLDPASIKEIWLQVDQDEDGVLSPGDVRIVTVRGPGDTTSSAIEVFQDGAWTDQPFEHHDLQRNDELFKAVGTNEGTFEYELNLAALNELIGAPAVDDEPYVDLLSHGIIVRTTDETYTIDGSAAFEDNEFVGVSEYTAYQHVPAYRLILPSDDVGIDHIEITQSVQNEINTLPVIRNKETLGRVFVTHDNDGPTDVEVRLTGWSVDPGEVRLLGTLSTTHTAPATVLDREVEDHSANFELPDGWTDASGLLVRAEVFRPGFAETDDSDNVAFAFVPLVETFDPAMYYIRMNVGSEASPVLEPTADVDAATATLADTYPVADPQFIELDSDVVGSVAGLSDAERIGELNSVAVGLLLIIALSGGDADVPVPAQIFGFTPDFAGTSDPAWSSNAPSGASLVSIGSVDQSAHDRLIMAHEINHNIGSGDWGKHAGNNSGNAFENGCGAGGDSEWQRLFDQTHVQEVGWDPSVGIIPTEYPDYQSYCQIWEVTVPAWTGGNDPAQWVSEYRWVRMTDRWEHWDGNPIHPDLRTAGSTTTQSTAELTAQAESAPTARIVSGFISADGGAELAPSFERPGLVPPLLESPESVQNPRVMLVVDYADGTDRTVPIALDFDDRHEESTESERWPFTVTVQDNGTIVGLTLIDPATGEVLDAETADEWSLSNVSFDLPEDLERGESGEIGVSIEADTDRTLYKRLLYSPNGAMLYPFGPAFTGDSLPVRFEELPGGESASFLLLVSDGVHTEFAKSPSFSLPHAPPEVSITRNERWRTFSNPDDQSEFSIGPTDMVGGAGEPSTRTTTTVRVAEPVSIAVGQSLTIDALGQDEFGNRLPGEAYAWHLVTGTKPQTVLDGGTGARFERVFAEPGTHRVVVTVTDPVTGLNASDAITVEVTVPPLPDKEAYAAFTRATFEPTASHPTVSATTTAITEGQTTTLTVAIEDADDDRHLVQVDWSDGTSTERIVTDGSIVLTRVFGDDATYPVNVTVMDDGFGVGFNATTVVVENVAPSVTLPKPATSATTLPDGEAIIARVGTPLTVTASSTDPGSDDLLFEWRLDDTVVATVTVFNDGTDPDPVASPSGTFPFTATNTTSLMFEEPGVHTLAVTVTDDDGGVTSKTIDVLVTGEADRARGLGYWAHQARGNGKVDYDDSTLRSLLSVVEASSQVFSEDVPASTAEEAADALHPRGRAIRPTAEAHLLAAWLNLAAGGVHWDERVDLDGDGLTDRSVGAILTEADDIVANESATQVDLERAKDLAEAINQHDD